jgi:hypothetical protein
MSAALISTAANPATEHASSVLPKDKTTKNTLKSYSQRQKEAIRQELPALAAAATHPEITLIDKLVNNIVPR